MRKLVIAAAVSLSLATISANTHALSLGEIEMYSALNQALDAEISIVSFAPGELDALNVRLASAEAFASAGVQRSRVLSALRFDIEQRPDGVPVVKVTSSGPIIEPFISFLLEVNSPEGGRVIREYTVLLDPPVFTNQQSELVVAEPAVIQPIDRTTGVGVSAVVDRADDPLAGVELDLASELATQSGTVSFDEEAVALADTDESLVDINSVVVATPQDAVLLPLDTDALGEPLAELYEPIENPVTGADGEIINLGAELLPQVTEVEPDSGDGVDVSLSQFAESESTNVIFSNEVNSADQLLDDAENIINLDSVGENINDSLSVINTQTAEIGQSVDLSAIVPGSNDTLPIASTTDATGTVLGTEVDLNSLDFEPEVTLEAIETTTVPVSSLASRNTVSNPVSATGEVLGEEIDISGIVPGDSEALFAGVEPVAVAVSSSTYRVQPNDTLWSIARANRPNGVTTQQMVASILEANRDAFVDGDINRLRNGAQLQIPGGSGSVGAVQVARQEAPAVMPSATVEDTMDAMATVEPDQTAQPLEGLTIVGVDESASGDGEATADQMSSDSDLDRNLEAVNKKMMLAQEELTSESLQRDELSSRVVELEESLANMKKLITLRESELGNLQSELTTAQDETDAVVAGTEEAAGTVASEGTEAEGLNTEDTESAQSAGLLQEEQEALQANLEAMERNINADASLAQERVDAQADADKNLASAEAQAKSVRLETEEDALKSQLAQLQVEKAELIETAQSDRLALVQQSEEEKAQLLADAKAERERIQAKLEEEKNRISADAETQRLQIAEEAKAEKEKLIAEANSEKERLSAESDAMRVRLEALEEEKDRLLKQSETDKAQLAEASKMAEEEQAVLQEQAEAEKQRFEEESTKVKDRLAALQAEANANLADTTDSATATTNAVMDKTAEAGSDAADAAGNMVGGGAAMAGGVLAAAPLQRTLGDRKKVLAAGGGLALLGLLGAWAMRRRKAPVAVNRHNDIPVDIDTDNMAPVQRAHLDADRGGYDEVEEERSTMARAAVAASAAAAATGAAVSLDRSSESREEVQEAITEAPAPTASNDTRVESFESDVSHQLVDSSMLDDTITEADVYLRYGLHGQAEDLLQTAIERAPENEEYHLKLLENYHDQQNSEGFKTTATNYHDRFGATRHWEKIAEMGRSLDSGDTLFSRVGVMDAAAGSAAAAGVAAAATASLRSDDTVDATNLDETLDASAEFDVEDLAATGNFDQAADNFSIDDLDDISLDEVDLAALDDDGTLNLEEIAGNQMSGVDLGTLDLTNPDGDSTLDSLTLDDADLNSLGDVTSNVRSGLESDIDLSDNYTADSNEMETMLDLAKAYIDMGDSDSAANALRDIVKGGNDAQKKEASDLLNNLN